MYVLSEQSAYEVNLSNDAVWLQANREAGSMSQTVDPEWLQNRDTALMVLGRFSTAGSLARMMSAATDTPDFIDIDAFPGQEVAVDRNTRFYHAQGLITADPASILHANTADCGEIAISGRSERTGATVLGLLHASALCVRNETYLSAIEYMCDEHAMAPSDLTVILGPSARAASYKFPTIDQAQQRSPRWQEYLEQDAEGMWHVDLHGRTIADLAEFGIEHIEASPIDTIADGRYFSNTQFRNGQQPKGYNGLFFAKLDAGLAR